MADMPLLSPMQRRTLNESTARINIAWGPVRAGKTVGLEIYRWMEYVRNAPDEGALLMSGKTLKTLERNVLIPMQETFGKGLLQYSTGKKEAIIAGRRVELEGANDKRAEEKIRGMTLSGALCNEITLFPETFFKQLLARMSVRGAKLFGTTNTDSPYHWLKTDFLDREDDLNLQQWKFQLDDNIYLDPDYVESLKAEYTGLWYKRFILGLWVLAAGAVYDMWDDDTHVQKLEPETIRKIKRWVVDCDYGTSNPTTFSLKGFWKEGGTWHAHTFKEYYHSGRNGRQKTDAEYADDLADWLPERIGDVPVKRPRVVVDPSAASFRQTLKQKRFSVKEADNSVLDGIRFVSSMLGSGRYTVDPSCTHTQREYVAYVWDEKAQKRGEDKPLKENDHCCDRDRYGLYTTLQSTATVHSMMIHH